MTRTEHIIDIINTILSNAGLEILDKYVESETVLDAKTAYSFIIAEKEEDFYENQLAFEMTSMILCYIDFRLDDFNDSFTDKKNLILQDIEDSRISSDLTLSQSIDNFVLSSSVPKILSVSGNFDTNYSKGILDIVFEVKTLASPK
jgi:hypothetical protein